MHCMRLSMALLDEKYPKTCLRSYPVYATLIARCWEERFKRSTIPQTAEELKPLKAEAASAAVPVSGPVQLDNFASVAPK